MGQKLTQNPQDWSSDITDMAGIACGFTFSGKSKSRDSYDRDMVCQTTVKVFDYIDTDQNGRIKSQVFVAHLSNVDIRLSPADMKAMKEFSDGDGMITKTALQHFVVNSSFYKAMIAKSPLITGEINKKKAVFHTMDTNKDGQLSKGEFGKTMKNLSRQQVDRVYDKFDKDRDQKLSEGEFGNMMNLDVIKKHREKTNPKIVIS